MKTKKLNKLFKKALIDSPKKMLKAKMESMAFELESLKAEHETLEDYTYNLETAINERNWEIWEAKEAIKELEKENEVLRVENRANATLAKELDCAKVCNYNLLNDLANKELEADELHNEIDRLSGLNDTLQESLAYYGKELERQRAKAERLNLVIRENSELKNTIKSLDEKISDYSMDKFYLIQDLHEAREDAEYWYYECQNEKDENEFLKEELKSYQATEFVLRRTIDRLENEYTELRETHENFIREQIWSHPQDELEMEYDIFS